MLIIHSLSDLQNNLLEELVFHLFVVLQSSHFYSFYLPILLLHYEIIKRGAEADIFLVEWHKDKAISKLRTSKKYRHKILDNIIRVRRTIHEANMLHAAKATGIKTPFVYFLDLNRAEI